MRRLKVLEPDVPAAIPESEIPTALLDAIEDPIGSDPLSEIVRPGETWLIVVSDSTRKYGSRSGGRRFWTR